MKHIEYKIQFWQSEEKSEREILYGLIHFLSRI